MHSGVGEGQDRTKSSQTRHAEIRKRTGVCSCNSYLVEKPLHLTGSELQCSHLLLVCTVQIIDPLVVVFDRHILVCDFKVVGQRQDVSANEMHSVKPEFN